MMGGVVTHVTNTWVTQHSTRGHDGSARNRSPPDAPGKRARPTPRTAWWSSLSMGATLSVRQVNRTYGLQLGHVPRSESCNLDIEEWVLQPRHRGHAAEPPVRSQRRQFPPARVRTT